MTWATLDDLSGINVGVAVTQEHLDMAQEVVELFAGTTEDASDAGNISSRNLRHLRTAVKYQAIWLSHHPEVLTALDVDSVSADGVSTTYAHIDARLLAPLAHRAIARLSWKQRGARVRNRNGRHGSDAALAELTGDRDSAVRDDNLPWIPMDTAGGWAR